MDVDQVTPNWIVNNWSWVLVVRDAINTPFEAAVNRVAVLENNPDDTKAIMELVSAPQTPEIAILERRQNVGPWILVLLRLRSGRLVQLASLDMPALTRKDVPALGGHGSLNAFEMISGKAELGRYTAQLYTLRGWAERVVVLPA
jgi:hypothetical protein